MNASGEFLKSLAPKTVLGLPICDLGWNAMLNFVERLVMLPGSSSTITFLDGSAAFRKVVDNNYRAQLRHRLLLPSGGPAFGFLTRMLYGSAVPVRFSARTFVPALLTFLDWNCRIGIVGEDEGRIAELRDHFSRHTPWHTVHAVTPDKAGQLKLDIIVVDAANSAEESRIEREIGFSGARLTIMAGSGLSCFVKGQKARRFPVTEIPTASPSFA